MDARGEMRNGAENEFRILVPHSLSSIRISVNQTGTSTQKDQECDVLQTVLGIFEA